MWKQSASIWPNTARRAITGPRNRFQIAVGGAALTKVDAALSNSKSKSKPNQKKYGYKRNYKNGNTQERVGTGEEKRSADGGREIRGHLWHLATFQLSDCRINRGDRKSTRLNSSHVSE